MVQRVLSHPIRAAVYLSSAAAAIGLGVLTFMVKIDVFCQDEASAMNHANCLSSAQAAAGWVAVMAWILAMFALVVVFGIAAIVARLVHRP